MEGQILLAFLGRLAVSFILITSALGVHAVEPVAENPLGGMVMAVHVLPMILNLPRL